MGSRRSEDSENPVKEWPTPIRQLMGIFRNQPVVPITYSDPLLHLIHSLFVIHPSNRRKKASIPILDGYICVTLDSGVPYFPHVESALSRALRFQNCLFDKVMRTTLRERQKKDRLTGRTCRRVQSAFCKSSATLRAKRELQGRAWLEYSKTPIPKRTSLQNRQALHGSMKQASTLRLPQGLEHLSR